VLRDDFCNLVCACRRADEAAVSPQRSNPQTTPLSSPDRLVRQRISGGLPATFLARRPRASLRALRTEKGLTVDRVADWLGVSASKVSRFETGQRGVSASDIRYLCDLYEVDAEQRARLAELAREGRKRAQWQPFNVPYSTYVGLEAEATSIWDYGLGIVPGLLQTS
jgi:transcriptional regulator with XRE-family HTH domain